MTPTHSKYPSIGQFRNVIKHVTEKARYAGNDENGKAIFDPARPLPTLTFKGTVKLHGTNAGIGFNFDDGSYWCQSRERILTAESDNAGFHAFVQSIPDAVSELLFAVKKVVHAHGKADTYHGAVIYGEWCGQGIQKGVAISRLPKMFVVFGIKLLAAEPDSNTWLDNYTAIDKIPYDENSGIYHIDTFGCWGTRINFSAPELSQNYLKEMTENVELCCPVGKHFGVEGTGEGIVWKSVTEPYVGGDFMFKVKGEKHSSSKVRTLAAVDIEKINSITECVETIVTENRLQQGRAYLTGQNLEVTVENIGAFLKWVANDCLKEETDTIEGSGLAKKDVCNGISKKARTWYFANL